MTSGRRLATTLVALAAAAMTAAPNGISAAGPATAPAPTTVPAPRFQGDYFGEMARAFGVVREVDLPGRALVVKLDRDGRVVRVPIRDDTELHFRDAWGELSDYFPGQHLMLFVYVDEDGAWTYPRAVQDDVHVSARHGWFATVRRVDREKRVYATHREERDRQGKVTKSEDKEVAFDPAAKVWKGPTPGTIDDLKVGDAVIQQLVERDGRLVAVEVFDRAGDDAVRAAQDERHRRDLDRLGLPAYVTDVEPVSGAVTATVAWAGAERARAAKVGDVLTVVPAGGGRAFAAAVAGTDRADERHRLRLAANARSAARLAVGQSVRVFLPGTGPGVPGGRAGVPAAAYR